MGPWASTLYSAKALAIARHHIHYTTNRSICQQVILYKLTLASLCILSIDKKFVKSLTMGPWFPQAIMERALPRLRSRKHQAGSSIQIYSRQDEFRTLTCSFGAFLKVWPNVCSGFIKFLEKFSSLCKLHKSPTFGQIAQKQMFGVLEHFNALTC